MRIRDRDIAYAHSLSTPRREGARANYARGQTRAGFLMYTDVRMHDPRGNARLGQAFCSPGWPLCASMRSRGICTSLYITGAEHPRNSESERYRLGCAIREIKKQTNPLIGQRRYARSLRVASNTLRPRPSTRGYFALTAFPDAGSVRAYLNVHGEGIVTKWTDAGRPVNFCSRNLVSKVCRGRCALTCAVLENGIGIRFKLGFAGE